MLLHFSDVFEKKLEAGEYPGEGDMEGRGQQKELFRMRNLSVLHY